MAVLLRVQFLVPLVSIYLYCLYIVLRHLLIRSLVKSIPKVIGFGLLTGSAIGLIEFAGGLEGYGRKQALARNGDVTTLEDNQKQGFWDVVNRRPLSQTVDELGDLVRPFQ